MFWTTIQLALREIRANVLRSGLTALGIIIGVAAVITMVTLGGGASASVTSDIQKLGQNLLVLTPGGGSRMGPPNMAAPRFDESDVRAIEREIAGIAALSPTVNQQVSVIFGNSNHRTTVTGTDNAFFDVRAWALSEGRIFTPGELHSGTAACVIGATVRESLYGAQSPLDTKLRVRDISCNVVGVLAAKGQSTLGQDQDDVVLMPLAAVQRRMTGKREIQAIWISAESEEAANRIPETLGPLMRERRHLSLNEEDDFTIRDMREIAETVQGVTAVLTAFLGAIAAVSLVVGGIGIMNIMLVSVTERTREIGIRLAIGAREQDVLSQFLIEAVLLSAAGGVVGIVLGLLMSWGAAGALGIPFVLDPLIVFLSFGFSALVGVVFGFFPARRAARLDPIEALRYE